MATRDEILRFLIEVSGEQGLEQLKAALAELGKESKAGEGQASALVKQLDKLTEAARGSAEFVRLKAALAETGDELARAEKSLAELNTQFDRTDTSSKRVVQSFQKAEAEVARLTRQQQQQALALQRVTGELQKAGVDVGKLATEEQRLRNEAERTSAQLLQQTRSLEATRAATEANAKALDAMGSAFASLRGRLVSAAEGLVKIGTTAAAAAAALAAFQGVKFFADGVRDAADFESALGRIQAAAGLTEAGLDDVKAAIEAAAIAASKDVGEAASAFEQLAREGLSAADAQTALQAALDFSTVAAISGADAVKALGDATGAFGVGAERTAEVADILTAASIKSGLSVGEFAETIKTLGPAAADAGLTLEETAAAVQLLAQNGIEGGRAAGALVQVLGALRDPASEFSKELNALGITTRDFGEVVAELGRRGGAAESAFQSLGDRSTLVLRALAQNGGGALREVQGALGDVAGATQRAADIINTDLNTSFANVQNAFADLRRAASEPLLEPLRIELDTLTEALRTFAESPEFESIRESLGTIFTAALEALREFVGELDLAEATRKIAAFAESAKTDITAALEGIRTVIEVVRTFAQTLDVIINALQTGIFGIAAAVAKLMQLGQELIAFQAQVLSVVPAVNLLSQAVGVDFTQAATDAEDRAAALGAVYDEFANRTITNANETKEALEGFGAAAEGAAESTAAAADSIGESGAKIGEAGRAAAEGLEAVEPAAESLAQGADIAAAKTEAATVRIAEATESAAQRLTRLRAELEKARQALATALNNGADEAEITRLEQDFDRLTAAVAKTEAQIRKAGGALGGTADQVRRLGGEAVQAAERAEKLEIVIREVGASAETASISLGAMSQAAVDMYREINNQVGTGSSWSRYIDQINGVTARVTEQRDAVAERIRQVDAEAALYDPLSQKLEVLRSQYALVDDAALQQLAQREQRLEQLRESVAQQEREVQQRTEAVAAREQRAGNDAGRVDIRVEVVAVNKQRSGDALIAELSDGALDQLASRILQRITRDLRGMGLV